MTPILVLNSAGNRELRLMESEDRTAPYFLLQVRHISETCTITLRYDQLIKLSDAARDAARLIVPQSSASGKLAEAPVPPVEPKGLTDAQVQQFADLERAWEAFKALVEDPGPSSLEEPWVAEPADG